MISLKGMHNWIFFRNSYPPEFHSYKHFMKNVLKLYKPKKILEWGTGNSTLLMSETLPDSEIHTIEGDRRWMLRWILSKKMSKSNNIFIHYIPVESDEYENLSMFPDESFDFVFCDGLKKDKCLLQSSRLVKKDGYIMTHDLNYKNIGEIVKKNFNIVEMRMDIITALMKKKKR